MSLSIVSMKTVLKPSQPKDCNSDWPGKLKQRLPTKQSILSSWRWEDEALALSGQQGGWSRRLVVSSREDEWGCWDFVQRGRGWKFPWLSQLVEYIWMSGSRATSVSETWSLPLRLHTVNSPYTWIPNPDPLGWICGWEAMDMKGQLYCTIWYEGRFSRPQKAWYSLIWKVTPGVGLKTCVIPVLGRGKERWDTWFTSWSVSAYAGNTSSFGAILAGRWVSLWRLKVRSARQHLEERPHIPVGEPTGEELWLPPSRAPSLAPPMFSRPMAEVPFSTRPTVALTTLRWSRWPYNLHFKLAVKREIGFWLATQC